MRLINVIKINKAETRDENPLRWTLDVRESWEKIKLEGAASNHDVRLGEAHKLILMMKGIRMTGSQKNLVLIFLRPGSKEEKMSINIII